MANKFVDRWKDKEKQPSIISKIKNVTKPSENLKQQISSVIQRIDVQTKTLDTAVKRFESRDADIFNRVVKALTARDEARANVFASELSEIRKVEKMLTHASVAMQGLSIRLNTVSEIGDLVTVLSPAKNILSGISSEMCSILPEASQELGNIGCLLSDIVATTSQGTEMTVDVGRINPEAEKILEEAELIAENRLEEQFPEVASGKLNRRSSSIEV